MTVPTSGSFNMFGSDNTTIQGAIVQGGGSAGALTNFNALINASNPDLFDPLYAGDVISLSQVKESLQYRNYPLFYTTLTIGTNLGGGFSSASNACSNSGSPATVYIDGGGAQGFYSAYINGKRLWANAARTIPFNGNNLWFKSSNLANSGEVFQVGTDGFIQAWGGSGCDVVTTPSIPCGQDVKFQGKQEYSLSRAVNLGTPTGLVYFYVDPWTVPDRFIVQWNGVNVIDTGYIGSLDYNFGGIERTAFKNALVGKLDPVLLVTYPNFTEFPDDGYPLVTEGSPFYVFNKTAASPTGALIKIYAPDVGTVWDIRLNCPCTGC